MTALTTWQSFKNLFTDGIYGFISHEIMDAAAALAFYSALALAPIVLLFITLTGILGYNSQEVLISEFDKLTGEQGGKAIEMIIKNADKNNEDGLLAGIISISVLAFSASAVFAQMQSVLNRIFNASKSSGSGIRNWIRQRILSIGMLFSIGFLLIVSLIINTVLSAFFRGNLFIWAPFQLLISMFVFTLIFALIFKFMPDKALNWKPVMTGSFLTSVLFSLGYSGISMYLGKSAVGSAYGAAGSLIVVLAWVYYSSLILFFGAELTRSIANIKYE